MDYARFAADTAVKSLSSRNWSINEKATCANRLSPPRDPFKWAKSFCEPSARALPMLERWPARPRPGFFTVLPENSHADTYRSPI